MIAHRKHRKTDVYIFSLTYSTFTHLNFNMNF